ncbi:Chromatin structure-remodeling complex protein rsc9 [Vermiconidia calcicola]|uniref:Chromatin structure-remodeling complex protein rsc9 n=1 Tax=Vermiconidia calcicola TaxID=1690605 RepID=A0ACC3NSX7_9PEZI|nr:Chromatin structure-remodeling complex protein rsc9 [Vermiconidia calcicola]
MCDNCDPENVRNEPAVRTQSSAISRHGPGQASFLPPTARNDSIPAIAGEQPTEKEENWRDWIDKVDIDNGDSRIATWLYGYLVHDDDSTIDSMDIHLAYVYFFRPVSNTPEVLEWKNAYTLHHIIAVVKTAFQLCEVRDDLEKPFMIRGLRWRKLPATCKQTMLVDFTPMHEWIRRDAHKLLCIPQPDRTRHFLKMNFVRKPDVALSVVSIWQFYLAAFARPGDTHSILDNGTFYDLLPEVFPGIKLAVVSKEYGSVLGLCMRKKPVSPTVAMEKYRQKEFRRYADRGLLDLPQSRFGANLAEAPLMAVPHTLATTITYDPSTSPFIERLRRRRGENDQRLPYGDEEPGFPGVSLKKEQQALKSKWRRMRDMYTAAQQPGALQPTLDEWGRAADEVLDSLPLPPVLLHPGT